MAKGQGKHRSAIERVVQPTVAVPAHKAVSAAVDVLETAVRRNRVADLRLKHWSLREIAEEVGVSLAQVQRDLDVMLRDLAEQTVEKGERMRAVVSARLDGQARQLQTILDQQDTFDADGKRLTSAAEDGTKVKAIAELRRIEMDRVELYGAKEKVKSEFEGAVMQLLHNRQGQLASAPGKVVDVTPEAVGEAV